jgi:hypothetical protein
MLNTNLKVDLRALPKLSKAYPEESRAARKGRITEALLVLLSEVKKGVPVGAGPIHFRDTIFHRINMGEPVTGILGSPSKYGEPLEYGTNPHFPPVAPIQHWVEKKLGYSGKDAKSIAFLIARAISRRGTKGAHMFEKGLTEKETAIIRILEMIPADIVRAVNK